jgi:predicted DNA-binding protein (MmcQ/YjbR family)
MATFDVCLKRLRKLCLELPETSEVMAWGHPNFRAGKKTFAVLEEHKGELSLAVKVTLEEQQELLEEPRFYLTPYVGPKGWISLRLGGKVDWKEVERLVLQSYRMSALARMLQALDARGDGR